ncbi:hypothetical protein RR46_06038 [Papilio xuthus]|uniref:Uncharacterized protein n=1 Tax=Papilio xuthus TaxID=66420 RepID=A0A194Q877_PAPXU|nr:hypothetical protein RR46_06038 [Papilio xuthus]
MQIPYTPCHCCASEHSVCRGEVAASGHWRRVPALAIAYNMYIGSAARSARVTGRGGSEPAPALRTPIIPLHTSIETLSPSAE